MSMKTYRLEISKFIYSFLLSLIFFSVFWKEVCLNLYLLIYVSVFFLALILLEHKKNAEHLFRLMILGTSISIGYAIAKLLIGNINVTALCHRECGIVAYRIIVIIIIGVEYICILVSQKAKKKVDTNIDYSKSALFSERKSDLDRLSKYIKSFNIIGVLGDWGSGKTYLVDEYIHRHKEEYEVIKIETLTCNLDRIDVYLFEQLEKVLWNNRIYPRYSKQIQNLMSDKGILKQLQSVAMKGTISNVTAFHGLCSDIQKFDKPILLVCEDIDRISENNASQIAKVLDLCAKIADKNVKVIYEYDQNRMTELGFGIDYMEKYIPYMMNLSDIPFREMVVKALEEKTERNGNLGEGDFNFLSLSMSIDLFLSEKLGIKKELFMYVEKITSRKVKIFVDEVNLAMENEELTSKDNRKIIIAFYYLKNFMWQLYEQISFNKNLQDEIKFERHVEDHGIKKNSYYSIMELIDLSKKKILKVDEINKMFTYNEKEVEKSVIWNRNKLALLNMFGFNFQYLQRYYEYMGSIKEKRVDNPIVEEDISDIQCIEHNAKINSLIRNLYMNGKSEYTNNEANAIIFIDKVLFAPVEEREEKWNEYFNQCFHSSIYKDNKTIFMFGVDNGLSLAKALRTVVHLPKYRNKCEEIKELFLDFWMSHNKNKELLLETVKTFRLIEPQCQTSFIKAINCFTRFDIVGNMNTEKVYIEFLCNYISIAFRLGYLFDGYQYVMKLECDIVNKIWPVVNQDLYKCLNCEGLISERTNRCKMLYDMDEIIEIANLDPVLVHPVYGISSRGNRRFEDGESQVGEFYKNQRKYKLNEMTGYGRLTSEKKVSYALYVYIASRDLDETDQQKLEEYKEKDPDYVRGVKEGWSILFLGECQKYVICPGIVPRAEMAQKVKEDYRKLTPDITYLYSDGTKVFDE